MEDGVREVSEAKGSELIKEVKNYSWTSRIIFFLDIFIAFLILFFSRNLMKTAFGRSSLIFGFIMLVVITLLGILRKLSSKT